MTTERENTNPAYRLLEILTKVKTYEKPSSDESTLRLWCYVFNIPISDDEEKEILTIQVVERLLALYKLFAETEAALLNIPNLNEELFIEPISRLAKVIEFHKLNSSWYGSGALSDVDMTALKFSAHQLSLLTNFTENQIPTEEIKALLEEVTDLTESILVSSLPVELRNSLVDMLEDIRKAIFEYRIRGAITLREALAKGIGTLAVNKEVLEESRDYKEIQALGRMLVRIDKAYTFAMKVKPVLEAAANILPVISRHIK